MGLDYEIFKLGNVRLQRGGTLPDCKLAYKAFGKISTAKDILYPTWYSGQADRIGHGARSRKILHHHPEYAGQQPVLVAEQYARALQRAALSARDHVRQCAGAVSPSDREIRREEIAARHRLSMGALQTFHWGALFPDMVERIAPFCGSAKCSRHNFVFLEGVKAALTADGAFNGGWYKDQPTKGLRAMARVYAGWGFSQAFYRERLDIESLGYSSLEDFLVGFWEGFFLPKDANNLLAMLWNWQNGDIGDNELYKGDFKRALGAIKAKAYVMPGQTDLYFPPEDSQFEVVNMLNAKLLPVSSIWGHFAGGPGTNPADGKFIDDALKQLLSA